MEHNDVDTALIEDYLFGRLDTDQRKIFDARLNSDPDFKKQVNELKLIIAGLHQVERDANLKSLKELEDVLPTIEPAGRIMPLSWLSIAATISVIVVVTSVLYFSRSGESADVFQKYFAPYPTFESKRGGRVDTLSRTAKGYQYYDQGRYAESITVLQEVYQNGGSDDVLFYIANAYLAQGNGIEAKKIFLQLSVNNSSLRARCLWYLSLAYLKLGEKEQSIRVLKEIRKGNSSYAQKADDVLKEL